VRVAERERWPTDARDPAAKDAELLAGRCVCRVGQEGEFNFRHPLIVAEA
jgi:hypothetical protein